MQDFEKKSHPLSAFGLMMIAVITVDGIRNLSINAQFGLPLVTLFIFAGITFFLPIVILTAKLAIRFPHTGGSYLWIQDAFGTRWGFVSIWLQWVYNMLWYPTIFVFLATTLVTVIAPSFKINAEDILFISLVLFWLITGISCMGIRAVSWVSSFCAILGTLLPMLVIVGLAIFWLLSGKASATPISWQGLIPGQGTAANLAFFVNILFSLMGIDIVGMHAGDVQNPKKNYSRILLWSGLIILISMTLSSLALCVLLSPKQLGLVNGLLDAAQIFFGYYHISFGMPLLGAAIVLGCFGVASSWIIGLARALQIAAKDVNLPKTLQKVNRFNMPHVVLLIQALIVTLLFGAYVLFPDINASYWILSAMSSQLALAYYILLFVAACKLLKGAASKWLFGLFILGIVTSIIGIAVGFLPPINISGFESIFHYEVPIVLSLLVFISPLILLFRKRVLNYGKS